MTWGDADSGLETLAGFVSSYDRAAAGEWCAGLIQRLVDTDDPFPAEQAPKVLSKLRANRWMDLLEAMTDAFIRSGLDLPTVRRQHAQALIEGGRPVAAAAVLQALVDDLTDEDPEMAEARGLLGRCYKQMYVEALHPGFPRNQTLLRRGIEAYAVVYRSAPDEHLWHGVNLAALLARAKRDGVAIADQPSSEEVAADVLAVARSRYDAGKAQPWDLGTAMEASLALGDDAAAMEWLGRYVQTDAGSFEFAGTLRQLEEVWQLRPEGDRGTMLTVLRSAILAREGGGLAIDAATRAADVALETAAGSTLERVLGHDGVQSLNWYRTGLARSEAVAKICDASGTGVGTGFLLAGAELSDKLPADEMFVITNAHVVSETDSRALYPEDATIGFEALGLGADFRVAELIFSSPHDQLDVSVLRLDKPAPSVEPIPVNKRLPNNDGLQRVYVIGHPAAGGLSFSLQDNLLLDLEDPKLHYRAPTEPGSSGSPVFNSQWKLIALHHASVTTPLHHPGSEAAGGQSPPAAYAANEGLWIQAIRGALDGYLSTR